MSPLSAPVLGAAALVASPALWASLVTRSMPLDVALTRYLIAIGICWLVISVVTEFAFTPSPAKPDAGNDAGTTGATGNSADRAEETAMPTSFAAPADNGGEPHQAA